MSFYDATTWEPLHSFEVDSVVTRLLIAGNALFMAVKNVGVAVFDLNAVEYKGVYVPHQATIVGMHMIIERKHGGVDEY